MATASITSCPSDLQLSSGCLTPEELRAAYDIDPLLQQGITGEGQTIIDIVSYGSPTLQSDMDLFDSTFNLPPVNMQVIAPLTNIPVSDPYNQKSGWAYETTMDVEMLHAMAPEAKIIVLVSPVAQIAGTQGLPEFLQLEQYVIDHNLGYILSQSWGTSEIPLDNADGRNQVQQWGPVLEQGATQNHITYLTASGDYGATDYADAFENALGTVPTTTFTADSPWVTSVGGTSLYHRNNSYSEIAWGGSGGGFSKFYTIPDYQKTLPQHDVEELQGRRGVPDVSADADSQTGMPIVVDGSWYLSSGTSASAPVWAAIVALADQMAGHPLGLINPGLYKLGNSSTYSQDFHDVTKGNNNYNSVQGYPATQGWDPVTGWGTPDAAHLVPDLVAAMQ
jgi:subtilase family serine protease